MKTTICAALLAALVSTAGAQQTGTFEEVNKDSNKPVKIEEKAAQAATEAAQTAPAEDVTFEQVLAAPDDVELNEKFALTQIRKGDLRGAATTLERVLLVAPERYSTRMLYAVVLYRLDDSADAAREFDAVLAAPNLPPEIRDEALGYRAAVAMRLRDSHFDARLSLGLGYDSNRNAAPNGSEVLVGGGTFELLPGSTEKADGNLQFIGVLGASHDFGGASGDSIFTRLTEYRSYQNVVNLLDLQVFTPQIGGTIRTNWMDITPSVSYDFVQLSAPLYPYLQSPNETLRVSRRWSRTFETWLEFTHSNQIFRNTLDVTDATDHSGIQDDFTLGGAWTPDPQDRVSVTLLHRRKIAEQAFDAYRRESIDVEYMRLLGKGCYGLVGVTAQFDRYEQPDLSIAANNRADNDLIPQVLVGAPLDLLWKPLKNFTGTLSYQFYHELSSVENYTYWDHKVTGLVTYKWGI